MYTQCKSVCGLGPSPPVSKTNLVLLCSGYIGSAMASSLIRSDYQVYGLARTSAKATQLARLEVIPVLGSAQDSDAYIRIIKTAHIDVVIDCAGANHESAKILIDVKEAGKERLKEGGAKLGLVYTSGTWVHGSSNERFNDLEPVGTEYAKSKPPRLLTWRPQMERDVLNARDVLDTVVVRPALVYGREHAIWNSFFGPVLEATKSGKEGRVEVPLEPRSRSSLVHVDDVAEGLRCAIEKLPLISGTGVYPVFDLASSQESVKDIFDSFAEAVELKGRVEFVKPGEDDLLAEAMQTSQHLDSSRAEQLLGWFPRKKGFVAGMNVYAKAYVAAQEKI